MTIKGTIGCLEVYLGKGSIAVLDFIDIINCMLGVEDGFLLGSLT